MYVMRVFHRVGATGRTNLVLQRKEQQRVRRSPRGGSRQVASVVRSLTLTMKTMARVARMISSMPAVSESSLKPDLKTKINIIANQAGYSSAGVGFRVPEDVLNSNDEYHEEGQSFRHDTKEEGCKSESPHPVGSLVHLVKLGQVTETVAEVVLQLLVEVLVRD